jgi:hypothetical protein
MDELDKSQPIAEGMAQAEMQGKVTDQKRCLNCGVQLQGEFCHACGQKNLPRRQDIGDLIVNFISSFYSFESKFFKTFGFLLFKPGRIINDYNLGKRESYYHPARMYVFLSFVFFLVLSFIPDEDKVDLKKNGLELNQEEKSKVIDSLSVKPDSVSLADFDPQTIEQYDSIERIKPEKARDGVIEQYFTRKFIKLKQESGDNESELWKRIGKSFLDNIPKMIFFLLPVFALLLKLLYIRKDFYYSEHLVFTVFFYDFLYLIGTVGLICSQISWLEWMESVLFLLALFYLYKSMRKVYQQRRGKTVLKFTLLFFMFMFCLIVAFGINGLITVMLL